MKIGDVAIVGGLGLVGYLLLKNQQNQQSTSGGGGTSIGLDLGSLGNLGGGIPNINLGSPDGGFDVSGFFKQLTDVLNKGKVGAGDLGGLGLGDLGGLGLDDLTKNLAESAAEKFNKLIPSPDDFVKNVKDAVDKFLKNANIPETPGTAKTPEKPTPSIIPDLGGTSIFDASSPFREKLGTYGGITGGVLEAYMTKLFPGLASRLLLTLPIKGAARGAAYIVPYAGWAYAAADIGATIYELISGNNIAGSWLGWGEVIRPETETDKAQTANSKIGSPIPYQLNAKQAMKYNEKPGDVSDNVTAPGGFNANWVNNWNKYNSAARKANPDYLPGIAPISPTEKNISGSYYY